MVSHEERQLVNLLSAFARSRAALAKSGDQIARFLDRIEDRRRLERGR